MAWWGQCVEGKVAPQAPADGLAAQAIAAHTSLIHNPNAGPLPDPEPAWPSTSDT